MPADSVLHIMMVAAENAAVGVKRGGVGDVLRDVPEALAKLGHCVTVVIPTHGLDHLRSGAEVAQFEFSHHGSLHTATLHQVEACPPRVSPCVRDWAIDFPVEAREVYVHDHLEPFATDASKFSMFSAAVAELIEHVEPQLRNVAEAREPFDGGLDVVHLHDWHAAFVFIHRHFEGSSRFPRLRTLRCVYTIHNLALQGVRPLCYNGTSCFTAWYPHLASAAKRRALLDPDWVDTLNPMAIGIRLADAVHVVSPSYKTEILEPTRPFRNANNPAFYGGEGLEDDLREAENEGRLVGILNGCNYGAVNSSVDGKAGEPVLRGLTTIEARLHAWRAATVKPDSSSLPMDAWDEGINRRALSRLEYLRARRPGIIVTSVTRLADQKLELLALPSTSGLGHFVIDDILATLLEQGKPGVYVLLGQGDPRLEQFFDDAADRNENLIFVKGQDEQLATALYENGDLFLMPSSFEPCGISQMLAMRSGQPPLVHAVGGLRDTVTDGVTGFAFSGDGSQAQASALLATFKRALALHMSDPDAYTRIRVATREQRFLWSESARQYVDRLYRPVHGKHDD